MMGFTKIGVVITIGLLCMPGLVLAQNYEQVAPQTLPVKEGKIKETPPPPAQKNDQVIVKNFEGVVFVDQTSKINKDGVSGISGIKADGLPLLQTPGAAKIISPYFGKPLTLGGLDSLSRQLIVYYREQGHPVVNIVVPEQAIPGNNVQVLVMEGKLGKVKVEGNKWFDSKFLASQVRTQSNDIIDYDKVRSDVDWLNSNPFRQVDLLFTPGTEAGQTDIVLETKDRFPLRVYTGYDNTGNSTTGYARWNAGFNWGNAFGLDHQMNFQFTSDSDFEHSLSYAGSYIIPLPWRHTLTFYGSYSDASSELDPISQNGYSWQVGTRYNIPLPAPAWLRHSIDIGYDFKRSNNDLAFGGDTVYTSAVDVSELSLTYKAAAEDDFGKTILNIQGYYSPGGISGDGNDAAYQQARAGADTEYDYVRFIAQRDTKLPYDFTYVLRAVGQVSSGNLLPSEQLSFGGYDSIRGYQQNMWNTDEGWQLTNELRFPAFSISSIFSDPIGKNWANDKFQFLFFWDYGVASNRYIQPGESRYATFSSIGPGFRYSIGQYFSMRFDYGIRLNDSNVGVPEGQSMDLAITLSY